MIVFFDIDDTLINHRQAQRQAALMFLAHFDNLFPHHAEAFCSLWEALMQKHFGRFLRGEISFQEQRRRRLQELFQSCGLRLSDAEADRHFELYLQYYEQSWALFDDVLPCLEGLTGHTLGIISNGDGGQQRRKLERMGIGGYFSLVLISSDVGVAKPDQRIFRSACCQLGVSPAECFYVGDNLEVDAHGSRAAGMRGVWLQRSRGALQPAAIPTISTLAQLASGGAGAGIVLQV